MRRFQPPPSFVRFNAGEGKVGKGVATIRVARNPVAKLFSMPSFIHLVSKPFSSRHPPFPPFPTFHTDVEGRFAPPRESGFDSSRNSLDRVDGFFVCLLNERLIRIFLRLGFNAMCFSLLWKFMLNLWKNWLKGLYFKQRW